MTVEEKEEAKKRTVERIITVAEEIKSVVTGDILGEISPGDNMEDIVQELERAIDELAYHMENLRLCKEKLIFFGRCKLNNKRNSEC